jgi:hypothetical protein
MNEEKTGKDRRPSRSRHALPVIARRAPDAGRGPSERGEITSAWCVPPDVRKDPAVIEDELA